MSFIFDAGIPASIEFSGVTASKPCFFPRPRWAKCGQYIEGGEERWKELSRDKTSDDMVDMLLAEITGTDIAVIQAGSNAAEEFFEGQVRGFLGVVRINIYTFKEAGSLKETRVSLLST